MLYQIITLITPLLTAPYISRILGAENLGIYSYTLSIVNYFTMIAYLGVSNYGCKKIAEVYSLSVKKIQETFWSIYAVQLTSSLFSVITYFVYFLCFVSTYKTIYLIQGIAIFSVLIDVNWFFVGIEKFPIVATRNSIIKILTVVSIFVLVNSDKDLALYALIMVLGTFLSNVITWFFILKEIKFQHIKFKTALKKHIKGNIALFIPAIATLVYHTMDKTMLGLLSDYNNVGYYYSADKVINIPLGIITSLGVVIMPRMSNLVSQHNSYEESSLLSKSLELTLFLSSIMSFGIAAVSKEFVPLFFGNEFEPCIFLIKLFAPILVIKSLSFFIQMQYMIPNNMERKYTIATFCGAAINLLFNFILIPLCGAIGATIGTLGAEVTVLCIEIVLVRNKINIRYLFLGNIVYIFNAFISFIVISLSSLYIQCNNLVKLFIEIVIGGIIYLLLCIPYWIRKKDSIFYFYLKKLNSFKEG